MLLDLSFSSKGMISSNELYNFTTSSRARLQLSSSRLPLATGTGKPELYRQRVPPARESISPQRQAGHGAAPERVALLVLTLSLLTAEPLLLPQPSPLAPKDLDAILNW